MNKDKKKQADELLRMLEQNIDKNDSSEVLRKSLLEQLIEVMRSSQYDCRLGYAYMKVVISNKADHPVETVYILLDKKADVFTGKFSCQLRTYHCVTNKISDDVEKQKFGSASEAYSFITKFAERFNNFFDTVVQESLKPGELILK